ncbi:peptidase domain-containing ABC transporter [Lignipirellula cremea]|uniref:Putative ABC transporter ATP-binding protein n=1 Tax=Lignipirellula cremea TaxID=2528010 RepID=A0A518DL10_9BACT|nr:ABC transporter ATP-binding protein [Lignipirellula cremea]QDU92516.1 putative ABC transporter ATP-binding protein [Lignipirellula cremea]
MTRRTDQADDSALQRGALRLLERFSQKANLTFDHTFARRALSEAVYSVSGDDSQAWVRRLVEAGESLRLRIRSLDCTLKEALAIVAQGMPVAFCEDRNGGQLQWSFLSERRGRKVRVSPLLEEEPDRWMTTRQLGKMLDSDPTTSRFRCVIGEAALGCQAPEGISLRGGKPLARLFALLRPERKDLWMVLIFSVVVGVLALASPIAVEALVNTVAFGRYLQPVLVLALLLFTFLAFAAAMRTLITYIVEVFQRRLFIRTVEDLAYRLPRIQQTEFDTVHGPELVNRFFDIVTVQKTASALLLDGVSIVLQTVIGMTVLAFYHPFFLGYDVVLLMLIGFVVFVLGHGAVKTAIKESKAKYAIADWLEELARHTTAFKLHSGAPYAMERADQLAMNWLNARQGHFRVILRQILFALGLQAAAATALLGLGGWLVIHGELTLGQLVAAELIVMMIVGSFAKLGKHMEGFYDLLASIDKLGALFDLRTEAQDKLLHVRDGAAAEINVRDVSYQYPGRKVIPGLTFHLNPGEVVALVGGPGSGKSTLIDLLCGLRTPSSGVIELDGIDLRSLRPDSLREHLSLARDTEIFQGTIRENVDLTRSNLCARDVQEALTTVGLMEELSTLPDGLETKLQTNGAPLSASQTTRLMLARAIVGRPRLLLIDGALDRLSDDLCSQLLADLTRSNAPWTLLIASGRSEVIDSCQRSIAMDEKNSVPADEAS